MRTTERKLEVFVRGLCRELVHWKEPYTKSLLELIVKEKRPLLKCVLVVYSGYRK